MVVSPATPLALGSASPRRRDILESLGIPIRVIPSQAEEIHCVGDAPETYLERVAAAKLLGAAGALGSQPAAGLLVADTIVVLDGEILNKPESVLEAEQMLQRLCGRVHTVFTRYLISTADDPAREVCARTVSTQVTLRSATLEELRDYAGSGEGLDKAGAYAAQGIGAFLVESIAGSYTNVVGLPACEVVLDLKRLGLLAKFP